MLAFARGFLMGATLSALAFVAWAETASAQSPVLRSLPDNTWTRVDLGGLSAPSGILAYSGMSFDARHRKLLVFGGGHADYWGNEVWAFDVDSLRWARMYAPDPASAYQGTYVKSAFPGALFYPDPNEPLSEARPMSRHSYDAIEYLDHVDQTVIFRGYTYDAIWSFPEHYNPNDTWLYSLDTNHWTWKNVSRQQEPGGGGHSSAYDPETRLVFAVGSNATTYSYSVDADTWTKLQDNPGPSALTGIHTVLAYTSPQWKKVFLFGSDYPSTSELWQFDIPTRTWSLLNPAGDVPPARGSWGLAYDSQNDALVAFHGDTYVYDLKSNFWRRQTPATGDPTTIDPRTFARLRYDPVNNVTFLVTVGPDYDIETWAYRYRSGSSGPADTVPPSAPRNLVTK